MRERQAYRCALCGGHHPPGDKAGCISIHHKKPKSKKGPDDPGNLVGLCRGEGTCNCHDKVDYLTLEQGIPFEQIMEAGVQYLLEEYAEQLPEHLRDATDAPPGRRDTRSPDRLPPGAWQPDA